MSIDANTTGKNSAVASSQYARNNFAMAAAGKAAEGKEGAANGANQMFVGMLKQVSAGVDLIGQAAFGSRGMSHDVDCTNRDVHSGFGGNADGSRNAKKSKGIEGDSHSKNNVDENEDKVDKVEKSSQKDEASSNDGDKSNKDDVDYTQVQVVVETQKEAVPVLVKGVGDAEVEQVNVDVFSGENKQEKNADMPIAKGQNDVAQAVTSDVQIVENSADVGQAENSGVQFAEGRTDAGQVDVADENVKKLILSNKENQASAATHNVSEVARKQAGAIANKLDMGEKLSVKVNVDNAERLSSIHNSAGNAALNTVISEEVSATAARVDGIRDAIISGEVDNAFSANKAEDKLLGNAANINGFGNQNGANGSNSHNQAAFSGGIGGSKAAGMGQEMQSSTVNGGVTKGGVPTQVSGVSGAASSASAGSVSASTPAMLAASANAAADTRQNMQTAQTTQANTKSGFGNELAEKTNAKQVVEQVKVNITKAFGSGNDKIQIQLHPEDMGRVDVALEIDGDGKLKAIVTASEKSTHEMLQRDASSLGQALKDAGLKADTDSLQFQYKGDDGSNADANNGNNVGDGKEGQNGKHFARDSQLEKEADDSQGRIWGAVEEESYVNVSEGKVNIKV
ncbi:MAG: hypothetical protein GY804_13165 [Alphaproteobacteria bacterium]|nr:hypothetical protein [Alphaproteobacteria bacterium]